MVTKTLSNIYQTFFNWKRQNCLPNHFKPKHGGNFRFSFEMKIIVPGHQWSYKVWCMVLPQKRTIVQFRLIAARVSTTTLHSLDTWEMVHSENSKYIKSFNLIQQICMCWRKKMSMRLAYSKPEGSAWWSKAGDPLGFNTRPIDPVNSSRGHASQFDLQLTMRESLSVI